MTALDHQASAVLGQADVDGKTNEISQFAPLLADLDLTGPSSPRTHCTPSATTPSSWSGKKAHYILVVQKNQPGLHAQLKNLPWRRSRSWPGSATAATAARYTARSRPPPSPPGWPSRTPPRPSASPAGPPAVQRDMAHRHRLRDHQPDRHPGHPRPARRLDPRPLADRGPHHIRDVTYREDASQVRTGNGPRVMASLRTWPSPS